MSTVQDAKAIRQSLISQAKKSNHDFFIKAAPGAGHIFGVKTPALNELAKQYKAGSFDLAEALWKAGSLEERIIAIKIMEKKGKDDPARLLKQLQQFSKTIDNWAVCDGLGMQYLRSIVKTHRDEIFALAEKYNRSPRMWERRLSLVMVEWYTRHSIDHAAIRKLMANLEKDEEYYVKKAVSWIRRNFTKGK